MTHQFAVPQTGELLHRLATQIGRTIKSCDATEVHDLRVAIRHYSQALKVVEAEIGRKGVEKIRRSLKQTMLLAGYVRDCDIAVKLVGKLDPPKRLQAALQTRRASAEQKLVAALRRWVSGDSAEKWQVQLKATVKGAPVREDAEHIVLDAVKRLFARGRKAEKSDKMLHPLRIAAKKLRYTLDLLASASPERVEQIKKLQSRLGEINDYKAVRRMVVKEGAGKSIAKRLQRKRDKKIRKFRKYWADEFAGKQNLKKWTNALRHSAA